MATREYGKVAHQFWTGETGRQLRQCGRDAQLLALYLVTNRHATMIGLYYLPLPLVAHEMGFTGAEVAAAMDALKRAGYCRYDDERELVWVCEMARFQIDDTLNASDKRVPRIASMLAEHEASPLARGFRERYAGCFHLPDAPSMPLRCPIKGASEVPTPLVDAPSMPESSNRSSNRISEHAQIAPRVSGATDDPYLANPGAMPTQRRKAHCAWQSSRGLDVPQMLHDELRGKLGGPDADMRLLAWYGATEAEWEGRTVGDTTWEFWRARFREWQGTTVKPLSVAKPSVADHNAAMFAALKAVNHG